MAIAVEHLLRHHDVLRRRFRRVDGEWRQHDRRARWPGAVRRRRSVRGAGGGPRRRSTPRRRHAGESRPRSRSDSPRGVSSTRRGRPGRVSLIVHHLACDAVSWPFLRADLVRVYAQLARGDAIALPPKTSSCGRGRERLADYARGAAASGTSSRSGGGNVRRGGVRFRRERDRRRPPSPTCARPRRDGLDGAETERRACGARRGHVIESALLTALVSAVTRRRGGRSGARVSRAPRTDAAFPELDVSRTVGWFTAGLPLCARAAPTTRGERSVGGSARSARFRMAASASGCCRSGERATDATAAAELRGLPRPESVSNYLGRVDPPGRWRLAARARIRRDASRRPAARVRPCRRHRARRGRAAARRLGLRRGPRWRARSSRSMGGALRRRARAARDRPGCIRGGRAAEREAAVTVVPPRDGILSAIGGTPLVALAARAAERAVSALREARSV